MNQIQGLAVWHDFISVEEEQTLLEQIDTQPWDTSLSRRTQHYGYKYNYGNKEATERADPFPAWVEPIVDRLLERGVLPFGRPDQLIVNEYQPGQGIYPHVDHVQYFCDGIASLSLGSQVVMDFVRTDAKHECTLLPRSVLTLHGAARYDWRHGIAARKSDHGIKRGRRVSLTFRKMKTESVY
jgi:alkylated DNA repair dioxygenase AlkB